MAYMHCPSCGLSILLRAPFLTLDRCPRCLARRGAAIPMRISEDRSLPTPADNPTSSTPCSQHEPDDGDREVRPADR
jgi:hypothetical protein